MIYIIVLNWNNSSDTINCVKSLSFLENVKFKIVICDNFSTDGSSYKIKEWFDSIGSTYFSSDLVILDENKSCFYKTDKEEKVFLIKNESNKGYSGGNNVGIRFSLNQPDMKYVWILNNDTEVEPNSLAHMVDKFDSDPLLGICGSKLIYFSERDKLQGLGGCYNSWLCTTKPYKSLEPANGIYDEKEIEQNIDFVIGASMLISKSFLEEIGLLCEDYFLYYEEIDICLRAKNHFNIGVSLNSIVYHKEGASTNSGKSMIADYCSVKNRLLVTKKFHPFKIPFVWISLWLVLFNRIKRKEFKKAKMVARILFTGK